MRAAAEVSPFLDRGSTRGARSRSFARNLGERRPRTIQFVGRGASVFWGPVARFTAWHANHARKLARDRAGGVSVCSGNTVAGVPAIRGEREREGTAEGGGVGTAREGGKERQKGKYRAKGPTKIEGGERKKEVLKRD